MKLEEKSRKQYLMVFLDFQYENAAACALDVGSRPSLFETSILYVYP